MIVDGGAELLLAAICAQARADVEAVYSRVTMLQKACANGRLERFVAANGLPLASEDERSALWWHEDRPGLPKELAAMVADIGRYRRYCRHCCRPAGRGEDGQVVRRLPAGGGPRELSAAAGPGGDRGRGAPTPFPALHGGV